MIEFKFPDIGEGIHEGVLLKWFVKAGDPVKEGDSLCEMETDKVNAELPSPATGIIKETKGRIGDTIFVGDVIVVIQTEEDSGAIDNKVKEAVDEGNAGVVGELEVSNEVMSVSEEGRSPVVIDKGDKRVLATPVARKMAYDLGIDLQAIDGTGPMGRIMKGDIQRAYDSQKTVDPVKEATNFQGTNSDVVSETTLAEEHQEAIKLSSLRRTIARRMTESMFTIPHTACFQEIDITKLVEYRETIKHLFLEEKGFSITYLPFIIKALVLTLKDFPRFNSQLSTDGEYLLLKKEFDIGIAVDTPDGLMVPVIRSADKMGILEVMEKAIDLSNRARNKGLKLEELKGSTFTITNFGAVGASFGTPIINYPEVAILGIGKIQQKPVVLNNEIAIRWILPISLAFDHRVIDGGDAGRFIMSFEKYIQEPNALLLR